MTRREAVIRMATLMGASVLGPRLFSANLDGTNPANAAPAFAPEELALLDEIGDTIIPTTDIPGAKAVSIGAFMAMMVRDCYAPQNQAAFKDGLRKIAGAYSTRFGGSFATGTPANRTTLLNELDQEQKAFTEQTKRQRTGAVSEDEEGQHYFRMMKELTILGYFTSEIGATKAVRFMEVPGRYDGNAPYKKGDRAWFS
ncbi:MAG: gluconate 2-dehydrogenase subunit 3 family protein [Opitutaceae bacterium]